MEDRERLEGLLKELSDHQVAAELAQIELERLRATDEEEQKMAAHSRLLIAEEGAGETWGQIVSMFDRERERVVRLSEWLATTARTLAGVTGAINRRA